MKVKTKKIFVIILFLFVIGTLKGGDKKKEINSKGVYQFKGRQYTQKEIMGFLYSKHIVPIGFFQDKLTRGFFQDKLGRRIKVSDSIYYLQEDKYYCTNSYGEAKNIYRKYISQSKYKRELIGEIENEKFFEFKTKREIPTFLRGYELYIFIIKDETEKQKKIKKFRNNFSITGDVNNALIIKFKNNWMLFYYDHNKSYKEINLGSIKGLENELVEGSPKSRSEFIIKLTFNLSYPLDKSYLRFRVHKCSYLPEYYTFGKRPVTKENVKEFVEYFWYSVRNHYCLGEKVFASHIEEDDISVKYTMLGMNMTYGDFGRYDRIKLFTSTWVVEKSSGKFGIYYGNRKTIKGRYNQDPDDLNKELKWFEKDFIRENNK